MNALLIFSKQDFDQEYSIIITYETWFCSPNVDLFLETHSHDRLELYTLNCKLSLRSCTVVVCKVLYAETDPQNLSLGFKQ